LKKKRYLIKLFLFKICVYVLMFFEGGTVDITVHEVVSDNSVKEIQSASGGGWGGILVDKAFKNLLIDLAGPGVYDTFKRTETEDWLDIWRDFEVKKRAFVPDKNARVSMRFPISFSKTFEKITKGNLLDAIKASKYAKDIEFCGDKIKISASLFKSLFEHSIGKTINHVTSLLRDENVRKIKTILMVGGYSESPLLQHAIKEAFTGLDVVIPRGASSTILRGALVYGHSPVSIRERVLKYTYGIETHEPFKEGTDPEHLKVISAIGVLCRVFSKHVEKGQIVKCNEPQVEKSYRTIYKFQSTVPFEIFATKQCNPRYTTECSLIGKLEIDLPEPEEQPGREITVSMTFSGTEIIVKVVDDKTGKDWCVFINFLG
jgi:hypothetical protein